jgi:hypothetical protein
MRNHNLYCLLNRKHWRKAATWTGAGNCRKPTKAEAEAFRERNE